MKFHRSIGNLSGIEQGPFASILARIWLHSALILERSMNVKVIGLAKGIPRAEKHSGCSEKEAMLVKERGPALN